MRIDLGIGPLVLATACLAWSGTVRAAGLNEPAAESTGKAQAWLASPPALAFRQRVADLARLYGESGGIDPEGYRITARRKGTDERGCASVEIETSAKDGPVLRRDVLAACAH